MLYNRPMENMMLTEEFLEELLEARNIDDYVSMLQDSDLTCAPSLAELLNQYLEQKNLMRSKVIAKAQINSTFGYQIFMGTRQASRDKILALAFAMRLNLRETTRLLQAGGANTLYAKSRRDAIIIFCIDHEYTLIKANQELYRLGERTIN